MCIADATAPDASYSSQSPQTPLPLILPSTWMAQAVYTNVSGGPNGTAEIWYDVTQQSLRMDFAPSCPFLQLFDAGIDSNYVPCSVIFRGGGALHYVYPSRYITCNYSFPLWRPDFLCSANATFRGVDEHRAEVWEVEWFSNFTSQVIPGVGRNAGIFRNIRTWGLGVSDDSVLPVYVREDLDTGILHFHNVSICNSIAPSIFTAPMHMTGMSFHGPFDPFTPGSDRTCVHYNSAPRRANWPCGEQICNYTSAPLSEHQRFIMSTHV